MFERSRIRSMWISRTNGCSCRSRRPSGSSRWCWRRLGFTACWRTRSRSGPRRFVPNLDQYKKQAKELVKAAKAGDARAFALMREHHPRLKNASDAELRRAKFALADAQLIVARRHGFESWPKFAKRLETIIAREHDFESADQYAVFAAAMKDARSPIAQFEAAVDAIVGGDIVTLERLLRANPSLVRARSTRKHHSTLLHYVGSNGVEGFRHPTPKNILNAAEGLLDAGAHINPTPH